MRQLNILYLSHESDKVLGSSRSLYNMIHALRGKVHPIVIVPSDGAAYEYFKNNGIDTYIVSYPLDITSLVGGKKLLAFVPRVFRDVWRYVKALIQIKNIAFKYKIDILHSNSSTIDIGYYLSKILNIPHVWHLREFQDLDFNLKPFYGWGYLLNCIHQSSATISITKAIQRHFEIVENLNNIQLFNAVRTTADICFQKNKDKYFLLCGNLGPAKGCDVAIRSFAVFNAKNPGYRLKFVGSISKTYLNELENLTEVLNVKKLVDFEGYQENPKKYYSAATAYLMCSPNEGMGRVTVEAMFYGCPVIGYNGGGTKEIITNGVNGYLFNNIEECVSLMNKVIDSKSQENLILRAQQFAIDNFSEEKYSEKMMKVYDYVLQKIK